MPASPASSATAVARDEAVMARLQPSRSSSRNTPDGIRTRAATLKGWRLGPLVDGGGRTEDSALPSQCDESERPGGRPPPMIVYWYGSAGPQPPAPLNCLLYGWPT